MTQTNRVWLTDAALRLGCSYWKARDLLLKGSLRGGRGPDGRLWVESLSVEELVAARNLVATP